jgi:phosphopantetheinyl transferase
LLGARDREIALWRAWVRKEAVLKAIGVGLGRDMPDLDLGLDRRPLRSRPVEVGVHDAWRLVEFSPTPEFLGTVAHSGEPTRVGVTRLRLADLLQCSPIDSRSVDTFGA